MPSAAKGAASPWFEVRAQKPADGESETTRSKGGVCRDVAFHEEMPKILSRYTFNNRHPNKPP
jgi:hypothetical protein